MKSFAEKVFDARTELGFSQSQLGERVGVSLRSILAYEKGEKTPRPSTVLKLARVLNVSVKFLTDENCENPLEDIEKDGYIEEARDLDTLIRENCALFAGGELTADEKEVFFEALTKAYIASKEEARIKFSPKGKKTE